MADQKIGHILDALAVTTDLDDSDMPVDALVLLKVVKDDGGVALAIGASESLDWISQRGLLQAAVDIVSGATQRDDED